MSDWITMGDDAPEGIEVPGGDLDLLGDLIAWTNDVRAIERASAVFPSLEAVIDDNGYSGPSPDVLVDSGRCWLLCGSRRNAVLVFHYLEEHAEKLDLLPDLEENKGCRPHPRPQSRAGVSLPRNVGHLRNLLLDVRLVDGEVSGPFLPTCVADASTILSKGASEDEKRDAWHLQRQGWHGLARIDLDRFVWGFQGLRL